MGGDGEDAKKVRASERERTGKKEEAEMAKVVENGRRRREKGVQEIDVGGVTASEDKSCQG